MEQRINGLSLDLISHPSDTFFELMIASNFTPLMLTQALQIEYCVLDSFMKGKTLLDEKHYTSLARVFNLKESFVRRIFSTYLDNLNFALNKDGVSLFEYQIINSFELRKFRKYLDSYSQINNLGIISKISWLREYFKVPSLDVFKSFLAANAAFRTSKSSNELILEKIFLISHYIKKEKSPVKVQGIIGTKLFEELKNNTFEKTLDEVVFKVKETLRKFGINFIYYDYDSSLKVQGFVARSNDEVYLGVSNKGKYHDIFWFTLCHELGHLLYGILTFDYAIFDDEEKMADSFAEKILIDQADYEAFIDKKNFTNNSILEFSEKLNVAPGIIVGRLQKDKYIGPETMNYLRKKA